MAEYIVDTASLKCNKGQCATKLIIPAATMRIAGKLAAHSNSCVPLLNIQPFGRCNSGTYKSSPKAVSGKEQPCVLDLMDQYYLADESQTVSDSMEIMAPLTMCQKRIREIIQSSVSEMTDIQHALAKKMNYSLTDDIAKQYALLWKNTNNVYELCEMAAEAGRTVAAFYAGGVQNCLYLGEGNEDADIAGRIGGVLEQLKELLQQTEILAALPKIKKKYLVTTESFAICRCGGILTFDKSGQ